MEQTRLVNLPIIGRVQHGEKINNKVKEYGYFIAKTQDSYMQSYVEKFDKLFKGKQSIDIEFFNEEPLSKKYVRYNQSGEVCRCPEGSNQATQRVKNGWQQIECKGYECQYRQKNDFGKCACNRIGWLKFLIPSVSTDRIFLMKITGQTSINKLSDYINLQKSQGKSIKGHYTLFLKQVEQSNNLGQTFNNYVLDILKKEESNLNKPFPQVSKNQEKISTNNNQNVNNKVVNQEVTEETEIIPTTLQNQNEETQEKELPKTSKSAKTTKGTSSKKETKSKAKSNEPKQEEIKSEQENTAEDDSLDNCYALLKTFNETIENKGQSKEYLVGEFADMNDKICNIVIRPENAEELLECDLGTFVRLDVKEVAGRKFAVNLEFIQKTLKKIAA